MSDIKKELVKEEKFAKKFALNYIAKYQIPPNHHFYSFLEGIINGNYTSYLSKTKEIKIDKCIEEYYGRLLNSSLCLDFGCGSGWASVELAKSGADVVGIDLLKENIYFAAARAKYLGKFVNFLVAEGEYLPFKKDIFDVCVCKDVLEHVNSPSKCILEINRTLKPKGLLFIGVPNSLWIFSGDGSLHKKITSFFKNSSSKYIKRTFFLFEIYNMLKNAEFKILDTKPIELKDLRIMPRLISRIEYSLRNSNLLKRIVQWIRPSILLYVHAK